MKKFSVIALVMAAALFCAIPAMAVTMDFSGYYHARGFYLNNPTLNDQTPRSDSFMDMRLKMVPVIKVHDRLKITGETFAVNEDLWGAAGEEHDNSFEWERAFLTANFDMFDLHVGRMSGGICGLTYCDSESDADRIKVGLKGMDPLGITLIYQKSDEDEYSLTTAPTSNVTQTDADNDAYMGLFSYKPEGIDSGILIVYYDYAAASGSLSSTTGYMQEYWNFNPWFKGTFGPVTAMAELEWKMGDYAAYESPSTTEDQDMDTMRWIVDGAFNFGPGNAGLGWAHADGDASATDNDYENANLGGADWEPLLILTNSTAGKYLGSGSGVATGNLNPDNGTTTSNLGFDIAYAYGDFAVMENVTLNAIFAWATADETARLGDNVDDDLGWEFDLGCKVQLMDNLTYDATVGYFATGDLYKGTGTEDHVDDVWAVMHTIKVTF